MSKPKILAFSGSLRAESFNHKLIERAAVGASSAGAEVNVIRLADYPLPVFCEDDEAANGLHENAIKLKQLFIEHDALLIASPEYNGFFSAALKNVIDWVSRPCEGEAPLGCFLNKHAAVIAASPGGLGGIRGIPRLQALLTGIRVTVIPATIAVSSAHDAFNPDASLKNEKHDASLLAIGASLANAAAASKA